MSILLGVHCEACAANVADPLALRYDPDRDLLVCEFCVAEARLLDEKFSVAVPLRIAAEPEARRSPERTRRRFLAGTGAGARARKPHPKIITV